VRVSENVREKCQSQWNRVLDDDNFDKNIARLSELMAKEKMPL
jgi:hypothetical protein